MSLTANACALHKTCFRNRKKQGILQEHGSETTFHLCFFDTTGESLPTFWRYFLDQGMIMVAMLDFLYLLSFIWRESEWESEQVRERVGEQERERGGGSEWMNEQERERGKWVGERVRERGRGRPGWSKCKKSSIVCKLLPGWRCFVLF